MRCRGHRTCVFPRTDVGDPLVHLPRCAPEDCGTAAAGRRTRDGPGIQSASPSTPATTNANANPWMASEVKESDLPRLNFKALYLIPHDLMTILTSQSFTLHNRDKSKIAIKIKEHSTRAQEESELGLSTQVY